MYDVYINDWFETKDVEKHAIKKSFYWFAMLYNFNIICSVFSILSRRLGKNTQIVRYIIYHCKSQETLYLKLFYTFISVETQTETGNTTHPSRRTTSGRLDIYLLNKYYYNSLDKYYLPLQIIRDPIYLTNMRIYISYNTN